MTLDLVGSIVLHVLIFEPTITGHHLQYVAVLTKGLNAAGCEVSWGLPRGAESSPEFAIHLASIKDQAQLTRPVLEPKGAGFRAWRRSADDLIDLTRKIQPDRVLLPYTGGLPAGLASRPRPWPFADVALEGLVMRGGWAYPQAHRRQRIKASLNLKLLLRVPWSRLHILDPLAFRWLHDHKVSGRDIYRLIPEPVESLTPLPPPDARTQLGLDRNGRWMVVTGLQDDRKGSDRLLEAFAHADLPEDARLLLAGKASNEVRAWIDGPGRSLTDAGRLHRIDAYLTEEQHELALNAGDYLAAPHVNPIGSSGLLVRAAALGRPVLATHDGWVGWATQTFALGRTIDVQRPADYADALADFFRTPPKFGNECTHNFVRYHTEANHIAHWLAGTREALGLSPDPGLVPWQPNLTSPVRQTTADAVRD